ncbi:unnamed protein product [Prorocentrum cordatum]|uniref:Uncharacterized protein n=1 Tax=Prorocentrum cordatum TaxID=2364126 RepID=A0ABN9UEN6_9DINO|nr:unnamed protein product [Polarella glacialis]
MLVTRGTRRPVGDNLAGVIMACSVLFVSVFVLGASGAPAHSLRGSGRDATGGKCCFNGCGDEDSCVTGHCGSRELCLKPQPDGGCDSSPPHGHGAKPSWCPAAAPQQLSSTAPAAENATGGRCCFNGCGDEDSCVTGYCGSRELCLKPQPDGGCDSSPPHGHGAKPSWCPAAAPQQLSSTAPAAENATGGKCCFNGCGDEDSCVTGYCGSRELCLKPQPDGGCDSSPPHGHGAKPSWCPAAAPQQLSSTAPAAENATGGKCCFNGCGDEDSCVTGYCGSRELCLKPQPDGGCDSSPPHGHGAKPSWCPAAAPQQLSSTAPAAENATGGKCCFNGCGDEDSCVTGYCGSRELCLKPQPDGGCDSSPPHGHGAKPSWCPAAAPQQLSSTAPAAENATGGKCCFNGCGDEDSCVTGYCGSRELCLKPQPDGGCDSSPPHGQGAMPQLVPGRGSAAALNGPGRRECDGGEVLLQRVRRRGLVRDGLLRLAGAVPEASARWRLRLVPASRPGRQAQLVRLVNVHAGRMRRLICFVCTI